MGVIEERKEKEKKARERQKIRRMQRKKSFAFAWLSKAKREFLVSKSKVYLSVQEWMIHQIF